MVHGPDRKDRESINELHGLSAISHGSHSASKPSGTWKRRPTPIEPPGQQRSSELHAATSGPYSRSALKDNLNGSKPRPVWKPQDRTLQASASSPQGRPAKRQRLPDTPTSTTLLGSASSAPHRPVSNVDAPMTRPRVSSSSNHVHELISDDELGEEVINIHTFREPIPLSEGDDDPIALVPQSSSLTPARRNGCTDPGSSVQPKFSSRGVYLPGNAPSSERLRDKHRLTVHVVKDSDPETPDPIEEFSESEDVVETSAPLPQRNITPSRAAITPNVVNQRVAGFESARSRDKTPHIDLHKLPPPKAGVQRRMKRKDSPGPVPEIMTAKTNFAQGPSTERTRAVHSAEPYRIALLVEKMAHGIEVVNASEGHDARWLVWDGKTKKLGIADVPDATHALYHYQFDVCKELDDMKWCPDKSYPFLQFRTLPVNSRSKSQKLSSSSSFQIGSSGAKGLWTLRFVCQHASINDYHTLLAKLREHVKNNEEVAHSGCADLWGQVASGLSSEASSVPPRSSAKRKSRELDIEPFADQPGPSSSVDAVVSGLKYRARSNTEDPGTADNPVSTRRQSARQAGVASDRASPVSDPEELVLVYQPTGSSALNITKGDCARLKPGEFLNDTLIEFGLKLWLTELRERNPVLADQVHVFSSFFYKKLNVSDIEEGYKSVRKWTSKVDLFEKKVVVVPINENLHWYLAIIYQPGYVLEPPRPVIPPPVKVRTRQQTRISDPIWSENIVQHTPVQGDSSLSSTTSVADQSENDHQEVEGILQLNEFSISQELHPTSRAETQPAESIGPDSMTVESESVNVGSEPMTVDVNGDGGPSHPRLTSPLSEGPPDAMKIDPSSSSPLSSPALRKRFRLTAEQSTSPTLDTTLTPADVAVRASSFYGASGPVLRSSSWSGYREREGQPKTAPPKRKSIVDVAMDGEEEAAPDEPEASSGRPSTFIFTFDSLGSTHPRVINVLQKYLHFEAADKKQLPPDQLSPVTGKKAAVPTQPNFCDCGVYLLHFARTFMEEPWKFAKLIMEWDSKRKGQAAQRDQYWDGEDVGRLREQLRERIDDLGGRWKAEKERKQKEEAGMAREGEVAPAGPTSKVQEATEVSDDEPILISESGPPPSATKRKIRPLPRPKGKKGKARQEDQEVDIREMTGKAERMR